MANGYDDKVIRRYTASGTINQYDVVIQSATDAGIVLQAGDAGNGIGLATSTVATGVGLDVVLEGTYFAHASVPLAKAAILAAAASGAVRAAVSTDAFILGYLDPSQAEITATAGVGAVYIQKSINSGLI